MTCNGKTFESEQRPEEPETELWPAPQAASWCKQTWFHWPGRRSGESVSQDPPGTGLQTDLCISSSCLASTFSLALGWHLLFKEGGVQGWELGRYQRSWQRRRLGVVGNSSVPWRRQESGEAAVVSRQCEC